MYLFSYRNQLLSYQHNIIVFDVNMKIVTYKLLEMQIPHMYSTSQKFGYNYMFIGVALF